MLLQSPLLSGGEGRPLIKVIVSSCCDEALDGAVAGMLMKGINHGPITSGVIGARKPHFDIWGNTKLPCNTEVQEAFDKVKNCLVQASALQAPDLRKQFILATDASDYAVGACLAQQDLVGKERPIAFLSKKLSPAQTRCATIEKEAHAILWDLGKLDV
ncbi:hypothetical protein MRX96_039121 [Rhipicephalus microplus]